MINNHSLGGLWFDLPSLMQRCESATYTRGLMLYRNQKILSLDIEPLKKHWLLLGEVQGSQRAPYEVSIELQLTPDGHVANWDSDCTCPVGHNCKHGAALMLKAAYQGLQLLSADARWLSFSPPTPEEVEAHRQSALALAQVAAEREAESQLLGWLSELERAHKAHLEPGDAGTAPAKQEQYLYLLSVLGAKTPKPELQIEVVAAQPTISGGWAKPKAVRSQPGAGQTVYDRATEADHEVLQLFPAMASLTSHYYAFSFKSKVPLGGQMGVMALQQAARTGRLLLDAGKGVPGAVVRWGSPLPLRWEWHEVASVGEPGWVLRARLTDDQVQLCLNNPPLYLDATQGLCGLAQAEGLGAEQLAVMLKSPTLKPSALKKHQATLMQRLGPVPLPPVVEQLPTLKGITPTAHLHLTPVPPDALAHRGLLQAQVSLDYAGRRGWWVGQGSTVLVDDAQGRALLQCDVEAELDLVTIPKNDGSEPVPFGLVGRRGRDGRH